MTNQQAKPKVLVADDERVIADTLAIILNQSGFEATAVYNGEKAVEAARTSARYAHLRRHHDRYERH
jgi:DNA-binding response OmpR family regulator